MSTQNQSDNWSEAVEDLAASGDIDAAISLLESVVSELEANNTTGSDPQLGSALTDLAKLYSSKGFSLKADQIYSRVSLLHCRTSGGGAGTLSNGLKKAPPPNHSVGDESTSDGGLEKSNRSLVDALPCNEASDDDWEAIADRSPDDLLSSECLPGISKVSLEDTKPQAPKRRGRGTFAYKKHELYSDHLSKSEKSSIGNIDNEDACRSSEGSTEIRNFSYGTHHVLVLADFPPSTRTIKLKKLFEDFRDHGVVITFSYGTHHVLVLADFPPSTRTVELEKLFEDFRDHGVVIRWVNDTTALAVFRTPSIALEAKNRIRCPFTVRILDDDDSLLGSISSKDLEPPKQRPKTSARTAQRLIAQGMGFKLPSAASFGSRELKKQEEDRKSRIVNRQKLKDDAWGADDDAN